MGNPGAAPEFPAALAGGIAGFGGVGRWAGGIAGVGGVGRWAGGIAGVGGVGGLAGGIAGFGGVGGLAGGIAGFGGVGGLAGGIAGFGGVGGLAGGIAGFGGVGGLEGGLPDSGLEPNSCSNCSSLIFPLATMSIIVFLSLSVIVAGKSLIEKPSNIFVFLEIINTNATTINNIHKSSFFIYNLYIYNFFMKIKKNK